MESSLTKFKSRFEELLLRFLWRQWSALGVSGYARSDDPWIVDPEALLLFSTTVARKDPRLFDEILDWLSKNAARISLQRLNRMQKEFSFGEATLLAAIAERLSEKSEYAKWSALMRKTKRSASEPQALFEGVPYSGESDPVFLKWGWRRGSVENRGLSQSPRPDQPATFLFTLRSLWGRQARAEILAWLLANDSGHPAEIARQTGYFRRSAQQALNEMELSGHVRSLRFGREKHFALRHADWRFLVSWKISESGETVFPEWIHWPSVFEMLGRTYMLLQQPDLADASENLQAIEVKRSVDFTLLAKAGFPLQAAQLPAASGAAFLSAFHDQLAKLLG